MLAAEIQHNGGDGVFFVLLHCFANYHYIPHLMVIKLILLSDSCFAFNSDCLFLTLIHYKSVNREALKGNVSSENYIC